MAKGKEKKKLEFVHSSGNVFRDLGFENADGEQFKAILAGQIVRKLDHDGLSVRKAQTLTGIAAADFSRIRNADLGRFTIDRLMTIINRLGSRIDVAVKFRRAVARRLRPKETELDADTTSLDRAGRIRFPCGRIHLNDQPISFNMNNNSAVIFACVLRRFSISS